VVIAVLIKRDGPGSVIFTQLRLGRGGEPYRMHKFRTLRERRDEEGTVAPEGDARVTHVGRWLRHCRLDELPQLLDVLRGRMALVGPRPEVPANLEAIAPAERDLLLSVRPGLTGPVQLEFIAEDELLAEVPDPTETYRMIIVPAKVRTNLTWLASRSFLGDLLVLLRTPVVLFSRRARARSRSVVERLVTAAG
jgi:lipopolysaccharide/colanic/teichoic acid biosynthesis glycosyltransferase